MMLTNYVSLQRIMNNLQFLFEKLWKIKSDLRLKNTDSQTYLTHTSRLFSDGRLGGEFISKNIITIQMKYKYRSTTKQLCLLG